MEHVIFQLKGEIIFYIIIGESIGLVILVYTLFYLTCYRNLKDMERIRVHECRFDSKSITRINFSYRLF